MKIKFALYKIKYEGSDRITNFRGIGKVTDNDLLQIAYANMVTVANGHGEPIRETFQNMLYQFSETPGEDNA